MPSKTTAAADAAPEPAADAVAPVEVSAGPEAEPAKAAPVAEAKVTDQPEGENVPAPAGQSDQPDAENPAAAAATKAAEEAARLEAEAKAAEEAARAEAEAKAAKEAEIHLPSALRIAIGAIDRKVEWDVAELVAELIAMGATISAEIEHGRDATMALYGITVTSHLGRKFLLNYWAAQARQRVLELTREVVA